MAADTSQIKKLALFCKKLQGSVPTLIQDAAGDSEKEVLLNVYQEKCNKICKDVEDHISVDVTTGDVVKYLQSIAQLLLDLTYVDECSLVDSEFPKSSAYTRVSHIIDTLGSIEDISGRVFPDKTLKEVLGPEMGECLHWRRGALLYMYCHTLNDQCTGDDMYEHLQQCLERGVKFLIAMFSTRSTPAWLATLSSNSAATKEKEEKHSRADSDEVSQLLSQGIFSDTHLLALMYCGEMCYWHTKCLQGTAGDKRKQKNDAASPKSENVPEGSGKSSVAGSDAFHLRQSDKNKLDLLKVGHCVLETYISVANGPLKDGGWSTTRAEEILNYFSTLKR